MLTDQPVGMTGNKFGKYLTYAIGEIILVVIGILIAVSINNWNDKRKANDAIKDVYLIIQNDLSNDIKIIDRVLVLTKSRDSIFERVITRDMTMDDYMGCKFCSNILNGFPDISLKTRGLKLLEANSNTQKSNYDSLSIRIIEFYDYYNTEIEVAIEEVKSDYEDNRYYFKNNMSWYEDYEAQTINKEFIKYALESQDYRNRVRSFYILYYKLYLGYLKQYKKVALTLIKDINKEIK